MDFRSFIYFALFILSCLVMVFTALVTIEGVKCKVIKPDTLVIVGVAIALWLLYLVR